MWKHLEKLKAFQRLPLQWYNNCNTHLSYYDSFPLGDHSELSAGPVLALQCTLLIRHIKEIRKCRPIKRLFPDLKFSQWNHILARSPWVHKAGSEERVCEWALTVWYWDSFLFTLSALRILFHWAFKVNKTQPFLPHSGGSIKASQSVRSNT